MLYKTKYLLILNHGSRYPQSYRQLVHPTMILFFFNPSLLQVALREKNALLIPVYLILLAKQWSAITLNILTQLTGHYYIVWITVRPWYSISTQLFFVSTGQLPSFVRRTTLNCFNGLHHISAIQQYIQDIHCIIFTFSRGMSYPNLLFVSNLKSLKDRRDKLSQSFF